MIEIKYILNDILDECYNTSDLLPKYKKFYIEYCDKIAKSCHGVYFPQKHKLRIYNLYRKDANIIATTLHELSHHIDYINRGTSGHSKEFYCVFKQLLYTALNMGIITIEDLEGATMDASDSKKIKKLIESYEPEPIDYKPEWRKVVCFDCKNKKYILLNMKFSYNPYNKTWDKITTESNQVTYKLRENNLPYKVYDYGHISFMRDRKLVASGETYPIKEELKKLGFKYIPSEQVWELETDEEGYREMYLKLHNKYNNVEIKQR